MNILEHSVMKQFLCGAVALLIMTSVHAADGTRYIALVNGGKDKAGHLVTTREGNRHHVDYLFKDNGRGPELKEEYTLADDGTFLHYQVKGVSTFGSLVDESFTRSGGKAQWKSTSDKGEQTVSGTAQYSPLGGTPQGLSVALAALGRRGDGKLPLIPSGVLTARRIGESAVTRGSETRKVELLALTGVGFTPTTVWATTDSSRRLFAYIYPGYLQIVEEGWESNAASLEKLQVAAEKEMLVEFNRRLAHPLPGATWIRNVRVFDSERAALGAPSDVLIHDGRVIEVSPSGSSRRQAARTIDAKNRVLLPGLFDMHVHVGFWDGGLHIGTGVTTVRDMGNDNATLLELKHQQEAGTLLMPGVVAAGFIEGDSPNASRSGFVIKDLAEAKKAVDWYHDNGFPQVKIYNSFPKEILADTTAYAHSKGIRVSGHVPAFLRAEDVVLAGYDEIQHINQVLLNFLVDQKTDTRTLERFYLPARGVADMDFDGAEVRKFIQLLADRKVVVDPTLATFNFIRQRDGELSQEFAAVADHVPPDVRRGFYAAQMKIPDDATHARYNKSYARMIDFVGRLYRAGVPIVAGTDDLPGFTLQRELELYVEAGLSPSQVLQIATYNGARYSNLLHDRGIISPGRRSDLILVDGDPTRNISDIRKVALVIQGDKAYYPSEVFEALGVKPFTPPVTVK
jgi:imidazolonepropionase-like amidohydrolase